jgi:hypothetical protein
VSPTKRTPRLSSRLAERDERGISLLPTIVIFFVCMLMLGIMTSVVGNEVLNSSVTVNTSSTRSAALAGFYRLVSHVELNPNFFTDGGMTHWVTASTSPVTVSNNWVTMSPNGAVEPCPTTGTVAECYYLTFKDTPAAFGPDGAIVQPERVVVQVNAIHGYPPTLPGSTTPVAPGTSNSDACGGQQSALQCAAVAYRSTLIRRSYLDYLQFDNSESMAPEAYPATANPPSNCATQTSIVTGCYYPAFQGQGSSSSPNQIYDLISGPFHTNSPFFLTCGDPRFTGPVEYATGGSSGATEPTEATGCTGTPTYAPGLQPVSLPSIPLPTPTAFSTLQSEAPSDYQFTGTTTLLFSSSGEVSVNGAAPQPPPPSGVIAVAGKALVSGVVSGGITVAASGNIDVTGNLTYACSGSGGGAGQTVTTGCSDMTGLISKGDIHLDWQSGAPLTVDAAMMAIGTGSASSCGGPVTGTPAGSIYTPGWSTNPTGGYTYSSSSSPPVPSVPTLTVNGALTENCRGAVGSYWSATAELVSGYADAFYYDARLSLVQPPYFLNQAATPWMQIALFGVPYGTPVLVNPYATITTAPTISNLPARGVIGGSFTATVATNSGGTKSVTSNSTGVCTVSGMVVTYVRVGTCSLTAYVAAWDNYSAASGSAQTFTIGQITPTTPTISNLPASGTYGGGFTATVATNGDGTKSVTSNSTGVCTVASSVVVSYVGIGTCSLTAHVAAGTNYLAANGTAQTFTIGQATPTTPTISNLPGSGT